MGRISFQWYGEALGNEVIISAIRVSLIVAFVSTAVSVVLGTAVALALDRYRFKGRRALDGTVYLPIVIPDITMAVMLLVFFAEAFKLIDSFGPRFTLASPPSRCPTSPSTSHSCAWWSGPGSTSSTAHWRRRHATSTHRVADIQASDPSADHARDRAGGLLALTLSLDDVVISAFVSGPGSTTLPVYVFSSIRRGVTPELNAISTLMLTASIALVLGSLALQRRRASASQQTQVL